MRFVRLSTRPPLSTEPHPGFASIEEVRHFFLTDIRHLKPPGRFDVTPRRIAKGALTLDEELIFTYQGRVVFTARSGTGLVPNDDGDRQYPNYFIVRLDTLRAADMDLHEVERQYNDATRGSQNLTHARVWTPLPKSAHTDALWARLGGYQVAGSSLKYEEADDNPPESYIPEENDRRQLIERQIHERQGQSQFRDALRNRYQDRCMVTGCEVLAVLEAAHIIPYRGEDDNHAENGLLLRSDIHTLFDLDLLGIEPDSLRVELHPNLAKEYGHLAGVTLSCKGDRSPSRNALRLRYERFCQRRNRPM